MKKIVCTLCYLLCLFRLPAQNITAAEYFFNSDPGAGNGTPIAIGAPATTVNFTASIPTTTLGSGFHTLAIRTKDENNRWSLFETRAVYVSNTLGDPAAVVAAEYFIDSDPGAGNGTSIGVGAAGNTVNFTAVIPTVSLTPGFHTLAIRTLDGSGVWGLFETRAFYITTSFADAPVITAAEYFIDADPGSGNGTPISIGASGTTVNFTTIIPTASLATGFHTLAIRTKNAAGVWGLFEVRPFYISTTTTDAAVITAAEFFIDNDPGAGNGTSIGIGSAGSGVIFTAAIATASLGAGFHTLAIRTRNADGVWGLFETRPFYISTATGNMGIITAAEYFLDTDPGVGNGSPLTFTNPGANVSQTFSLSLPPGTGSGAHTLVMRVRDANGVWSLFDTARIISTLPLDWVTFTGRKVSEKVALDWTTENESNTSHFLIERSKNGIDFTSIGRTSALGGLQNTYRFDDGQPQKGLNYYRLKQFDRNGQFKYSIIVKIFFGDAGMNELKLFPQPVQSTLNVVFGGNGNNLFIQVYDAAGKMVMNERKQNQSTIELTTTSLSKGVYWMIISDGIIQQKGQFVKQ